MTPLEITIFDKLMMNQGYAYVHTPTNELYVLAGDCSGMICIPIGDRVLSNEELNKLIQDTLVS